MAGRRTMKKSRHIILISLKFVLIFFFSSRAIAAEICVQWIAKAVSSQGRVEKLRNNETLWQSVKLNDIFCPGDMIRIGEKSRAGVLMRNDQTLRFDQNTTVLFSREDKKTSLIELLKGIVHFFSRVPRTLKVATPFVNGSVEGTEFLVKVDSNKTIMSVFEGHVLVTNDSGSLVLARGQSAMAEKGSAPALYEIIRPRDAVRWALYYPGILFYSNGIPATDRRAEASSLLSVGRVDEAEMVINKILERTPADSDALALLSIIAVVQNEKDAALKFANRSVEADPKSSPAYVALSYALQANFDLEGALNAVKESVKLEPGNALALARLSELYLSFGELDKALESADRAVAIDPELSRTQTVLGFAYLSQINTKASRDAFEKAIELDQTDPLPRLGMGLAMIRDGELEKGRQEIEIAASLDPGNSLVRSYLGKAYYEEKRDAKASGQFIIAEELDPLDPTPFFYNAIRKQSLNRPVEALHDLQKAIELNDNRAVYRSRQLLDEDLAARSASLARIYSDVGFQQLALTEGWKSVNINPSDYSAHRFLADSYAVLPRHEVARVSELLQFQLLQPLNLFPVQPRLAESGLFIFSGTGPGSVSFNEFNPLFERNRLSLQLSGVAGGNSTFGDELVVSAVQGSYSISAGQFHYTTDGFRRNNDLETDIYDLFAQKRLSHKSNIQVEFRHKKYERGDLNLLFDPDNFWTDFREEDETGSVRFGLHYSLNTESDLIASVSYMHRDHEIIGSYETEEKGYNAEIQHLLHYGSLNITSGLGHFNSDLEEKFILSPLPPEINEYDVRHDNLYVYTNINHPGNVIWTLGASADFFKGVTADEDQFNPKFGVTWNPLSDTTLRSAVFRTFSRTLLYDQTLEPTQVAGFNQFFDDGEGTDAWRYGIGIDQKFSSDVYAGAEFSIRDMSIPGQDIDWVTGEMKVKEFDVDEKLGRGYLYWAPFSWLALSAEYQYERFEYPEGFYVYGFSTLDTRRYMLGLNFMHPSGFSARIKPSYIAQDGEFTDPSIPPFMGPVMASDADNFWNVDASISYRLPKRNGIISLVAKNLFDTGFRFQDTDPSNPTIYPERLILVKFTLSF